MLGVLDIYTVPSYDRFLINCFIDLNYIVRVAYQIYKAMSEKSHLNSDFILHTC